MTRVVGSPTSSGGNGGELPAGAGPFVVADGAWVELDASMIPADGPDLDTLPDSTVQEVIDDHEIRLASLEQQLSTISDDLSALDAAVSDLATSDAAQDLAISALQSAVSTLQGQYTSLSSTVSSLSSTVSSHTSSISTLQSDVSTLQSTVSSLSSTVSSLSSTVATNTSNIATLQAAGITRTTIDTPFALGNAPTYAPILTLTIAPSTSRTLDGFVVLTGGSATTPTSGVIGFRGVSTISARRGSAGAPTVSGTPAVVGGTIPALAAQVVVSGNDIVLQARATGGPNVTAVFFYRWEADSPP